MKKIGLITFHASHNCGSMLQTFALQNLLNTMGNDVEIINFSNKGQQKLYDIFYENKNFKNILKNLLILPKINRIKNVSNSYRKFIKENFKITSEFYEEISQLDEKTFDYDEYICGSDQIWNITIEDSDNAYFLPFVNEHKKIAYAPSFGAKNPIEYANDIEYYKKCINDFDFLSIRENNGQKWIKEMTGKEVPVVLDPTLVADKKIYDNIEQKIKLPSKYIFYYAPGYKKDLDEFVYKISKKYNLPVIVFNSKQFYVKRLWKYNFLLPEDENPGTYLYLMKNAELIFTTSFHGTIFSTIYNKKFWTLKNGGMYGNDDRVITLVNQLGIKDRLIIPKYDDKFNYLCDMDYSMYNELLKNLKEKSINFLKEALDSNYETKK